MHDSFESRIDRLKSLQSLAGLDKAADASTSRDTSSFPPTIGNSSAPEKNREPRRFKITDIKPDLAQGFAGELAPEETPPQAQKSAPATSVETVTVPAPIITEIREASARAPHPVSEEERAALRPLRAAAEAERARIAALTAAEARSELKGAINLFRGITRAGKAFESNRSRRNTDTRIPLVAKFEPNEPILEHTERAVGEIDPVDATRNADISRFADTLNEYHISEDIGNGIDLATTLQDAKAEALRWGGVQKAAYTDDEVAQSAVNSAPRDLATSPRRVDIAAAEAARLFGAAKREAKAREEQAAHDLAFNASQDAALAAATTLASAPAAEIKPDHDAERDYLLRKYGTPPSASTSEIITPSTTGNALILTPTRAPTIFERLRAGVSHLLNDELVTPLRYPPRVIHLPDQSNIIDATATEIRDEVIPDEIPKQHSSDLFSQNAMEEYFADLPKDSSVPNTDSTEPIAAESVVAPADADPSASATNAEIEPTLAPADEPDLASVYEGMTLETLCAALEDQLKISSPSKGDEKVRAGQLRDIKLHMMPLIGDASALTDSDIQLRLRSIIKVSPAFFTYTERKRIERALM